MSQSERQKLLTNTSGTSTQATMTNRRGTVMVSMTTKVSSLKQMQRRTGGRASRLKGEQQSTTSFNSLHSITTIASVYYILQLSSLFNSIQLSTLYNINQLYTLYNIIQLSTLYNILQLSTLRNNSIQRSSPYNKFNLPPSLQRHFRYILSYSSAFKRV